MGGGLRVLKTAIFDFWRNTKVLFSAMAILALNPLQAKIFIKQLIIVIAGFGMGIAKR
jgi:hypothetical protein